MKKLLAVLLTNCILLLLGGCNSLDKKYDKENYAEVITEHADSASRSAFNRATVENDINDVRNEDFTYQELIDQGKLLQQKDQQKATKTR